MFCTVSPKEGAGSFVALSSWHHCFLHNLFVCFGLLFMGWFMLLPIFTSSPSGCAIFIQVTYVYVSVHECVYVCRQYIWIYIYMCAFFARHDIAHFKFPTPIRLYRLINNTRNLLNNGTITTIVIGDNNQCWCKKKFSVLTACRSPTCCGL